MDPHTIELMFDHMLLLPDVQEASLQFETVESDVHLRIFLLIVCRRKIEFASSY